MANPKTTGDVTPGAPMAPVEPAREANHPDEPKRPAPTATTDQTAPARAPMAPANFGEPEPIDLPREHRRPTREEFVKGGNDPKDYESRVAEWENEIRKHIAVGHKYPAIVKRLWNPLVPKPVAPSPKLREGMVRVKAIKTVLSNGMPYAAGDTFTMPKDQAERGQSKGALKILKS